MGLLRSSWPAGEVIGRELRAELDPALFDVAVTRHEIAVVRAGAEYSLRLDRQGSWSLADGYLYVGLEPSREVAARQPPLFAAFVLAAAAGGAVLRRADDAELVGDPKGLVWLRLGGALPSGPGVSCGFGLFEGDPHHDWWPERTQVWPPAPGCEQPMIDDWPVSLQRLAPTGYAEATRMRELVARHAGLRAVIHQQDLRLVVLGPNQGEASGGVHVCTCGRPEGDVGVTLRSEDASEGGPSGPPVRDGALDRLAEYLASATGS